ncbi:3-deoxy-7-phosphoheptulonate synthase [Vibrio europaeus]|uniref:Phospho-2-dehydro-3-deoxyheptonate aldolase n=1 Tax=Vibrio europaeus TaxID=300876 RepID=A0A178J5Y8_9VIBR|nr:3-deoxy-7-phosphoheptulonate synthase [Vibrio europaeus]MDC5706621.1 3-deoxy-7-phosphoheptulonate synthase [Vibrio europaeus]MDC5711846.1 3-deoxy-7-phosphoheptulonate synthase [Vibrio europaeus]MDC5716461.1 3-deoxy-7-phosphoheptulonate synthase [Vibrio europaeus]MDC5726032.1 3-deoxy-7-phosphoheptulonate synthase [Vibrio europaeus]MDC5733021.1 3-deoxy-7-phosphoheptulonate synthase [Vibrio europaeus]
MLSPRYKNLNCNGLPTPNVLKERYPVTDSIASHVSRCRALIGDVLTGNDTRILVVLGPCSIHDPVAALDYAHRVKELQTIFKDELVLVMRAYLEKPRTVSGWKGLISDPHLDGTHQIGEGLEVARKLLLDINALGLPVATEFLNVNYSEYIRDLIAYAAIGARTSESQLHRELASSIPIPVGFKNRTDGNVEVAINSVMSAKESHTFSAMNQHGQLAVMTGSGNRWGHVILRGGDVPNYDVVTMKRVSEQLNALGGIARVVVDASHANSQKKHKSQLMVSEYVGAQIQLGIANVAGVMLESFIIEGRQNLPDRGTGNLLYGQSITDACLGWSDTVLALRQLSACVRAKNSLNTKSCVGIR